MTLLWRIDGQDFIDVPYCNANLYIRTRKISDTTAAHLACGVYTGFAPRYVNVAMHSLAKRFGSLARRYRHWQTIRDAERDMRFGLDLGAGNKA